MESKQWFRAYFTYSSRHFLAWVNRWQDDGFRPLYDAWMHRLDLKMPLVAEPGADFEWLGLDENGAVMIKLDGKPISLLPNDLEMLFGVPSLGQKKE